MMSQGDSESKKSTVDVACSILALLSADSLQEQRNEGDALLQTTFLTKSKPQSFKVIYEARGASGEYTGSSCSEKLTCMRSHCSHTFFVMLFADNPLTILKLPKEYGCSSLALSTVYHWFCSAALKNRLNKNDRNHGRKAKEELLEQNQTEVQ